VPARGEWVMEHEHIPVNEYEKFAAQFNPTRFDAAKIVSLAKRSGQRKIYGPYHYTERIRYSVPDVQAF
jgi:alpha-L-fucosidase